MATLARDEVLSNPDLLAHMLLQLYRALPPSGTRDAGAAAEHDASVKTRAFVQLEVLLAARRVCSAWRTAAARPLIAGGLQLDMLEKQGMVMYKYLALAEYLAPKRMKEQTNRDPKTDYSCIEDDAVARWLTAGYEAGGLGSFLPVTPESPHRTSVVRCLKHTTRNRVWKPYLVVAPPSKLRQWRSTLQQEGVTWLEASDAVFGLKWTPESTGDQVVLCPSDRPSGALRQTKWAYVVLDMGHVYGSVVGQYTSFVEALKQKQKQNSMPPVLVVLADASQPIGHVEARTMCELMNFSFDSKDLPSHMQLVSSIDRYSFGDEALQRWAFDEHLLSMWMGLLQPYALRLPCA